MATEKYSSSLIRWYTTARTCVNWSREVGAPIHGVCRGLLNCCADLTATLRGSDATRICTCIVWPLSKMQTGQIWNFFCPRPQSRSNPRGLEKPS